MIGKDNLRFELELSENYFGKKDTLTSYGGIPVKVISEPKLHYSKWYWKILNFITFKRCFNEKYTYLCQIEN